MISTSFTELHNKKLYNHRLNRVGIRMFHTISKRIAFLSQFFLEFQFAVNVIAGRFRIVGSEKLFPQLGEDAGIYNHRIILWKMFVDLVSVQVSLLVIRLDRNCTLEMILNASEHSLAETSPLALMAVNSSSSIVPSPIVMR